MTPVAKRRQPLVSATLIHSVSAGWSRALTGIKRICLCLPASAIISCSSGMYSTCQCQRKVSELKLFGPDDPMFTPTDNRRIHYYFRCINRIFFETHFVTLFWSTWWIFFPSPILPISSLSRSTQKRPSSVPRTIRSRSMRQAERAVAFFITPTVLSSTSRHRKIVRSTMFKKLKISYMFWQLNCLW